MKRFLAHLSQRLNWGFPITFCPLSLVVVVVTFHIFIFFSRTTEPISAKLGTKHSCMKGIQVCSKEELHLFQGEIIMKQRKCNNEILKSFILQNHWANSNPTWHKAFLPFLPRGDNGEIAKIQWQSFKNLHQNHWANFSQTWNKHSCMKGIHVFQTRIISF